MSAETGLMAVSVFELYEAEIHRNTVAATIGKLQTSLVMIQIATAIPAQNSRATEIFMYILHLYLATMRPKSITTFPKYWQQNVVTEDGPDLLF
ncbi:hypothetical protein [Celeribacter naphthalenivorans]|uniref:hypothetical protein n=1 Tax=Celeribacter naphthalenivorans TaxID=1614694 RepID=UPI001CF9C843|nr:hypothetical protein [Celeribacter naphthalenivorans]